MRTHSLEGRKREERVGELRNVARHKRALTSWRGGRGRSGVGELRNVARQKRALTTWRGGRGRSGLVSFEMWHVTNEHSLPDNDTCQYILGVSFSSQTFS